LAVYQLINNLIDVFLMYWGMLRDVIL